MHEHYLRPDGLPPTNHYSHAVACEGRLVAISGQIALDAQGDLVGPGDIRAQARQVFENLKVALAAAGTSLDNVVKLNIYLTDIADLPGLREIRDGFLSLERPPASTLVAVTGLVDPRCRVEIDALAVT